MGKTYNKQVNTRIYYNIEVGVYAMKDIETVWALRGKAPQKSYDLSRTLTDIWRFGQGMMRGRELIQQMSGMCLVCSERSGRTCVSGES